MADKKKTKLNKGEVRNVQQQLLSIELDVAQFTEQQSITVSQLKTQIAARLNLIADALDIERKSAGYL